MKQVAFITGSSRGIGLGIARHLARKGFDLAINGVRDESAVSEVLTELRSLGATVIYCQGSIADTDARAAILANVNAHFGRLNLLVNNAGIAPGVRADMLEATEESFDQLLNTNLKGAYFLTQAVARWMIEQKAGASDFQAAIITVSSMSATVASVNRGDYCISKAGLSMATQLFAVRLGEFGIPVYEVRPGIIRTDMTAGVAEKYDALIADGLTVQPRWGIPDDVGRAVAAIAEGSFPYSTGQVFMIDGGLTLARL
ncbi:3-ketoacyl-ACP reductase [Spirosoma utsteinense]|uniref:NAD(P)-dependent dehydrogenase (Short-subunit alcohol dehydrogenase family) n=1 Tax=Spirosoma utsteinense TaxID=2585773 RepID=A0ABR6W4K5_9BACT|nr:3-ketoacyl-ACP reductase [Spirosoma utsteinense]MBC3786705.1 NAD(P)-dependent dehydrogenase (short-subunit alcohol dehydrogenase family) [Spirosoma utsteinense]MBC3791068.1 NAD(P)-dependent dehydrogenase (short-subunit alcohol dehydrogenase family) [Spirosoma utsteinense]